MDWNKIPNGYFRFRCNWSGLHPITREQIYLDKDGKLTKEDGYIEFVEEKEPTK